MGALRMYSHRGDLKGLLGAGTSLVRRVIGKAAPVASVLPGAGLITAAAGAVLGSSAAKKVVLHPIKTGYDIGQRMMGVAPRKKYRRMNVANTRALNRAVRRIQGAEKLFRKVLQVQGKSHGGTIKPKHRKR